MKDKLLNGWRFWALGALVILFGADLAIHLTNFPVRLGMLRVVLLLVEQVWTRVRI